MGSVNKVILVGHLGKDPDSRFLPNGDQTTTITVANPMNGGHTLLKPSPGARGRRASLHGSVEHVSARDAAHAAIDADFKGVRL